MMITRMTRMVKNAVATATATAAAASEDTPSPPPPQRSRASRLLLLTPQRSSSRSRSSNTVSVSVSPLLLLLLPFLVLLLQQQQQQHLSLVSYYSKMDMGMEVWLDDNEKMMVKAAAAAESKTVTMRKLNTTTDSSGGDDDDDTINHSNIIITAAAADDDAAAAAAAAAADDDMVCWPWKKSSDTDNNNRKDALLRAADEWWTHHPTWESTIVNDTHHCYQPIQQQHTTTTTTNAVKAALYQAIYDVQYGTTESDEDNNNNNHHHHPHHCSRMFRRHMWSSGLGADFINVVHGLYQAVQFQRPFQLSNVHPWHYAAGKNDMLVNNDSQAAACPSRDMYCYFLNLTNCPVGEDVVPETDNLTSPWYGEEELPPIRVPLLLQLPQPQNGNANTTLLTGPLESYNPIVYQWILDYAMRPQAWLRRKVYDFRHQQHLHTLRSSTTTTTTTSSSTTTTTTTTCTVMHVRRADVIKHPGMNNRRYFSIAEYIAAGQREGIFPSSPAPPSDSSNSHSNSSAAAAAAAASAKVTTTIFLLTDDANAIQEALHEYPEYDWRYIDRYRYRADEGGFEAQTPSGNFVLEMTVLLSILQSVPQCDSIVYGASTFADQMVGAMKVKQLQLQQLQYDDDDDDNNIHNSVVLIKEARVDQGGVELNVSDPSVFRNLSKEYKDDDDNDDSKGGGGGAKTRTRRRLLRRQRD